MIGSFADTQSGFLEAICTTPWTLPYNLGQGVAHWRTLRGHPKRAFERKSWNRLELKEEFFLRNIPSESKVPCRHPADIVRSTELVGGIGTESPVEDIFVLIGVHCVGEEGYIACSGTGKGVVVGFILLHLLEGLIGEVGHIAQFV